MTRVTAATLGMEFDDFLFAPIGDDRNGMLLSVLSVLARLDFDPWQRLPGWPDCHGAPGIKRLGSLLATFQAGCRHSLTANDCRPRDRIPAGPVQFRYRAAPKFGMVNDRWAVVIKITLGMILQENKS
jgi:hypothetical protein